MPTPHESSSTRPTPPQEPSSPVHSNFTSCPPEEERESQTSGESRSENTAPSTAATARPAPRIRELRLIAHPAQASSETSVNLFEEHETEKREATRDAGVTATTTTDQPPSPAGSPDPLSETGNDARLSQSMAMAALDSHEQKDEKLLPTYIVYPPLNKERLSPYTTSSFLRPGSKFKGCQKSDRQEYNVQVEIQDVNLEESFLCGYLKIEGLTKDYESLTTFFEGEIIGPKHLFRTTHASWNSSEKIDLQHWARFPAFRPLAHDAKANPSSFTLKNYLEREHLFMRWKEYFLVPDHRVKNITGASFEGFYYICFDQVRGRVSGIYFHAKSEKFQQLELRHVPDGGCFAAVEFR